MRFGDAAAEGELEREGVQLALGRLLRNARVVLEGSVSDSEAFRAGRVRIQDEGSQLVAEIAGQGTTILDCCAAPGGKTLVLAERNPQAHIVACEVSAARLGGLRDRLRSWARASNASWRTPPRSRMKTNSTWFWPTFPAAEPARWRAIRRFAISLRRRTWSARPNASVRSWPRATRGAARRTRGLFHVLAGTGGERTNRCRATASTSGCARASRPRTHRGDGHPRHPDAGGGRQAEDLRYAGGFSAAVSRGLGHGWLLCRDRRKISPARSFLRRQPQLGIIAAQQCAQRLHHQLVIGAHGQAGHGDAAHHSRAGNSQRK